MPEVKLTRILAAAGDYSAGDILSDAVADGTGTAITFTFPEGVALSEELIVTHATLTASVDALVPRVDLDLFDANPSSSELDDNAAASVAAADREEFIGTINFPALADRGAIAVAETTCYIPFRLADGTRAIRGIARTVDAFTNESASMTITIRLFVERAR